MSSELNIRPVTFDDAITVIDNPIYAIHDLSIKDSKGRVAFTTSITNLKPYMQTHGHDHPSWEVYEFIQGKGLLMIDNEAHNAIPGLWYFIEPGRFHKVINISADNLIFRCYAVGQVKRPHLAVKRQ